MDMSGARIAAGQTFDANLLHVGTGGLFLRQASFGGAVDLHDAHVEGQIAMEGVSVAEGQAFRAARLHVGPGGLFINNAKFGGPVDLPDAHVEGPMDMSDATVIGQHLFNAERLNVGASGLSLTRAKFGGRVDLLDAHVEGLMDVDGARVAENQTFYAQRLSVGSSFLARFATFSGPVNLVGLRVDRNFDLRGSRVRQLDLTGAVVRDDLRLGGQGEWLRWALPCTGPQPCLIARNAGVGNLQDDERAWPSLIALEGFSYTHLGSFGGEQGQDLRNRPIEWWRDWLSRDPVYSPQPYAQLAGVLAAGGNRDGAAEIRFFGRDRERSELLRGCTLVEQLTRGDQPPCRLGPGLGASALQLFVGYGIGTYAFRAAYWALALALIGSAILWFAPGVRSLVPSPSATGWGSRQKSLWWCFGASLQRVLPLITISKEFGDFFDDPARERLTSRQHFAFAVLALCGWALGLFVVAAFSGLIQS